MFFLISRREINEMKEQLEQIKVLAHDVAAKQAVVLTNLNDLKSKLADANTKLDAAIADADDPADLQDVKDTLQGVDDAATAAIGTVTAPGVDTPPPADSVPPAGSTTSNS